MILEYNGNRLQVENENLTRKELSHLFDERTLLRAERLNYIDGSVGSVASFIALDAEFLARVTYIAWSDALRLLGVSGNTLQYYVKHRFIRTKPDNVTLTMTYNVDDLLHLKQELQTRDAQLA